MRERSAISLRSVLLGLLGIIFICALTPYNDFALANAYLVGGNLPFGLVTLAFGFAVLVNGPLSRWAPRYAFTSGEMAVAFMMILVACAVPGNGLMRWWPATLVSPLWQAQSNAEYLALLRKLNLPSWIFPKFPGRDLEDWVFDPAVTWYLGHTPEGRRPPYAAWLQPTLMWGIFLFALYGALLFAVSIMRRQWHDNERLPFPIAQVQLALITQPEPGRGLNAFFAKRSFWVAFIAVFLLRLWNGCARYWPQYFPPIPLDFNLIALFTERPLSFVDQSYVAQATIYLLIVGITYFVPTQIAFSIWFFVILRQPVNMVQGTLTGETLSPAASYDEHTGAVIAFALTFLWIGRRHWLMVAKQALRGAAPGEPQGRYLSYPFAFWGFIVCLGVMTGWLVAAGCSVVGAIVAVVLLVLMFLTVARVVAETGFVHGQLFLPLYKPYQQLQLYGFTHPVEDKTYFLTAMVQSQHYDFREVVPVYASHGMKIADKAIFEDRELHTDGPAQRRTGRKLFALMFLSLLVAYPVSVASTLWTEYNHEATLNTPAHPRTNPWGLVDSVKGYMLDTTTQYSNNSLRVAHSPIAHQLGGFAITWFLSFMRLRYAWWPLHPVGFLLLGTYPSGTVWFSVLVGWICKVLIVRFAGAKGYLNGRPFFLGIIVGEAVGAVFWLCTGLAMNWMHIPFRTIVFTPT